jgi:hypothetical protein
MQLDRVPSQPVAYLSTWPNMQDERHSSLQTALREDLQASSGNLYNAPSYLRTLRAIIPPTQSSLEFELMYKHPEAYPPIEPCTNPDVVATALIGFHEEPAQVR